MCFKPNMTSFFACQFWKLGPHFKVPSKSLPHFQICSQGGGGAHPARDPLKLEKNMIFWRKIMISHTKYPKHFRGSLCSVQFFQVSPPPTWNPGSAPGSYTSDVELYSIMLNYKILFIGEFHNCNSIPSHFVW